MNRIYRTCTVKYYQYKNTKKQKTQKPHYNTATWKPATWKIGPFGVDGRLHNHGKKIRQRTDFCHRWFSHTKKILAVRSRKLW